MQEYKEIEHQLEQRYAQIQTRLQKITHDVQYKNEPLSPDFAEQAVQRENEEVLIALDDSIRDEMNQIEATLARLRAGEYGICAACEVQIPILRLTALPHTTLCVQCAEKAGH